MKKEGFSRLKRGGILMAGMAGVLSLGVMAGGDAQAIKLSDSVTISPLYQRYMQDVAAGNGAKWKLIPNKYVSTVNVGGRGSDATLPEAYSLKDAGYGTTVKNQGTDGDCWAYATTTAIESNLKKTQGVNIEFSPKQIDYLFASGTPYSTYLANNLGFSRGLGEGGSFMLASYAVGGQYMPVTESAFFAKMQANDATLANYASWNNYMYEISLTGGDSYTRPMSVGQVMGEKSDYLVTDYRWYMGAQDHVPDVKNAVYNYGAAYVGTVGPDTDGCWDESTKTIVDLGASICGEENGHAMSIIGWDDNHAYTDPSDGTEKTGAFLLQNSWGETDVYAELGVDVDALEYVWLGYDFDESLFDGEVDFASIQGVKANTYHKVYDTAGLVTGFGSEGDDEINELVYTYDTGGGVETIDAVAVAQHGYAWNRDVEYVVSVSAGGGDYVEVARVYVPGGESGQKMVQLSEPLAVSGAFKVKLTGASNGEALEFDEGDDLITSAMLYTSEGGELVVPNTAAAPNTGAFTGDSEGVNYGGTAVALMVLTLGVLSGIVFKNRKSIFHKVGFEKK